MFESKKGYKKLYFLYFLENDYTFDLLNFF